MYRILTSILLVMLTFRDGICSDSTYISIRWTGEVDKPYWEFVFYRVGGYNPEPQGMYERNPYVLQCALSAEQLMKLKEILLEGQGWDSNVISHSLYGCYTVDYFEGLRLIRYKQLNSISEFLCTYSDVVQFFKGSKFESKIKSYWIALLDRMGLKPL